MRALTRPGPACRALVAAWLVALALVQTLGLLHRLAHPGGAPAGIALRAVAAADDGGVLASMFAGHDADGAACDLYDGVAHADLDVGMPSLPGPAIHAAPAPAFHRGWQIAAQAAGALARGPPSLA